MWLVNDAECRDDTVARSIVSGEDLDASAAVVVDAPIALERHERRHVGLALALGGLNLAVGQLVKARGTEYEALGLPVVNLGLLAGRGSNGDNGERVESTVVQPDAGEQRGLAVAFRYDQPALRVALEEIGNELLLEWFGVPAVSGVEYEIRCPVAEMPQREGLCGRLRARCGVGDGP
jgi:hypothetical protein